MTPALVYLAGAAVTGGISWHVLTEERNSRDLDERVGAYLSIGIAAAFWPLIWAAWAIIQARRRWG